jgi:hypothetical protein
MLFNIVTNIISVVFAGKHNHFKNDFLAFFKKYLVSDIQIGLFYPPENV